MYFVKKTIIAKLIALYIGGLPNYGKKLLKNCRASGLRIANGRTLGDTRGCHTCYSHTGAPSVIDYMLVQQSLQCRVEYFHVQNLTPWSIHCVLSTSISTGSYFLCEDKETCINTPKFFMEERR